MPAYFFTISLATYIHLETKNKLVLGGEGLAYHFAKYTETNVFDIAIDIDTLFSATTLPISDTQTIRKNELPIGIGIIKF